MEVDYSARVREAPPPPCLFLLLARLRGPEAAPHIAEQSLWRRKHSLVIFFTALVGVRPEHRDRSTRAGCQGAVELRRGWDANVRIHRAKPTGAVSQRSPWGTGRTGSDGHSGTHWARDVGGDRHEECARPITRASPSGAPGRLTGPARHADRAGRRTRLDDHARGLRRQHGASSTLRPFCGPHPSHQCMRRTMWQHPRLIKQRRARERLKWLAQSRGAMTTHAGSNASTVRLRPFVPLWPTPLSPMQRKINRSSSATITLGHRSGRKRWPFWNAPAPQAEEVAPPQAEEAAPPKASGDSGRTFSVCLRRRRRHPRRGRGRRRRHSRRSRRGGWR